MHLSRRIFLAGLGAGCLPGELYANPPHPRIVSLDYGVASTLLSLGVTPVGVSDLADWSKWVVEPVMPGSVNDLGNSFEVNFEILRALNPDVILTTPFLDELLPKLEPLAKTVRLDVFSPEAGPALPAAITATRKLAAILGREKQADIFLDQSEDVFRSCRALLAKRSPPALGLISFMDARHARIYSSPGLFDGVLQRLGLTNAWTEPSNYWGFETIGIEELSGVADPNAMLLAFEPVPGDVLPKLAESPLWNRLAFSRPGHLLILPSVLMFGMVNEALRLARLLTDILDKDI